MKKTLLCLDENLASSIALRYADCMPDLIETDIYLIHVEEPDNRQQAGTGWVRRTMEKGIRELGREAVQRLLRTEKVRFRFRGAPNIVVGDREREVLFELKVGEYDLYMEGNVSTPNPADFFDLVTSKLYSKAPCPILMVKNLAVNNRVALLCGDGVDHDLLAGSFLHLTENRDVEIDLVFFRFQEKDELSFLDRQEGGSSLEAVEKALLAGGKQVKGCHVVSGTPEVVGDYLKDFAFVASTLPTRKSPRLEVMANTPASLLLCH